VAGSDTLLAGIPDQVAQQVTCEPARCACEQRLTEAEKSVMCQYSSEEKRKVTLDHDAEEDRPQAVFSNQVFDYHRLIDRFG
jgi:hypothetical protein